MIVDLYCHIVPQPYVAAMDALGPRLGNIGKRLKSMRQLYDLDARFAEMDEHGAYRQVISLPNPSVEEIADAKAGAELCRIGNDSMAALCAAHPDRFPAFVAAVGLKDVEGAVGELERAITQLGAKGVQIFSNIDGRPLDSGAYEEIFAAAARHDLPVWLHPTRTAATRDYAAEDRSRFEMWWCFGWPYETSVAVSRLVLSGLFDRHPGLKLITHHLGGMIPYFDGRIGPGMEVLGARTADEDYSGILPGLQRPHLDYFRDLYADTALFGARTGLLSGLEFFGAEHVVFASDTPFGPIGPQIESIKGLDLKGEDFDRIMHGNAERLLNMTFQ